MAMQITKADAKHAVARLENIKRRISSIKERAEETTEKLVRTAEVGGAAFGAGLIQGRTGGVEVFGVPLELGLGLGLNAFAHLGGAGKASSHLHNVGDGFLAAYLTTLGRGVGSTWKDKTAGGQQQVTAPQAAQIQAATKGVRLTPEEIAMAAAQAGVQG